MRSELEPDGPTMQVNILEARNRLSQLIRAVREGETIVIANRGRPVARLVPAEPDERDVPNGARLLERLARDPLPAHRQRTHESIEADIRAEREGWDRSTSTAVS